MNPLISIIVPIYNVEKYICQCVESIINQTYKNLEIILVDDGSPDNCGKICDEYALKDNRIKVIHKENGGISDARNAGLDIATGEYIAFVDSDDWIEADLFNYLINNISDTADLVMFGNNFVKEKGIIIRQDGFDRNREIQIKTDFNHFLKLVAKGSIGYAWNKLYSKQFINNHRFENIKQGEDLCFVLELLDSSTIIQCVDVFGYNYRQCNESLLHTSCIDTVVEYDKFNEIIREGIKGLKRSQNIKFYNVVMQTHLLDIAVRDIVKNDRISDYEKKEYMKALFKEDKRDLRIKLSQNKLCAIMIVCAKLGLSGLFLTICNRLVRR